MLLFGGVLTMKYSKVKVVLFSALGFLAVNSTGVMAQDRVQVLPPSNQEREFDPRMTRCEPEMFKCDDRSKLVDTSLTLFLSIPREDMQKIYEVPPIRTAFVADTFQRFIPLSPQQTEITVYVQRAERPDSSPKPPQRLWQYIEKR